ncbi:Uncharacterised protein [Mycobacteroides abscessus subsp. abscessus]|nr:Uncharacterised protein [Mycobacteroides abscessus subsp. abscessus]
MTSTPQLTLTSTAPSALREIRQLNASLDRLETLETDIRESSAEEEMNVAERFERVHRAALKVAGLAIERANAQRKRKLPLNVWQALERMGGVHRVRAREAARFVELRRTAGAYWESTGAISERDVREHAEQTLAYLYEVKEELLGLEALAA